MIDCGNQTSFQKVSNNQSKFHFVLGGKIVSVQEFGSKTFKNVLVRANNVVSGLMQSQEKPQHCCPDVVQDDLASEKTSSNSCPAAPKVYLGYYLGASD